MTLFLSVEAVIGLHDSESQAALIDRGKLEGAVQRPSSGFGGQLVHTSIWSQASALMHGVNQAHAFEDGNKRTAWLATDTFLRLNRLCIAPMTTIEMTDYGFLLSRLELQPVGGLDPSSIRAAQPLSLYLFHTVLRLQNSRMPAAASSRP